MTTKASPASKNGEASATVKNEVKKKLTQSAHWTYNKKGGKIL